MENIQTSNSNNGINGNGNGNDAFVRTADALASAADGLAAEFQRRKQAEIEQAKREEQQTTDLREKLVSIHQKIGALLGLVGETAAAPRSRKATDTQRGRAMSEETEKAKAKVFQFVKANPGVSRGDIARNCKLDTSLVGRVLQILFKENTVKMSGERRAAVWTAK